jgi:hypothetical protein
LGRITKENREQTLKVKNDDDDDDCKRYKRCFTETEREIVQNVFTESGGVWQRDVANKGGRLERTERMMIMPSDIDSEHGKET